MPVLVDSNVLLDVINDDPTWRSWSVEQLSRFSETDDLIINPVIYAEVSGGFLTWPEMRYCVVQMGLHIREIPESALFQSSRAFLQYRRRGGNKLSVLPDFFIGAHAEAEGWKLISRDKGRYSTYFPAVTLITPDAH